MAVRLQTSTFRRNTCANLNIRLFYDHTTFDRLSSCATVVGSEHPLTVRLCQLLNRDDADPICVITTIAWTEPDAPSCLVEND